MNKKRTARVFTRSLECAAAAALMLAASATSAATVYYVDLVNNAPSSIVALDIARTGSDHFHPLLRGNTTLPGAGAPSTVVIRLGDDGCLRDLRVRFADGHTATHRGFDVCRLHSGDFGSERRSVLVTGDAIEPAG